MHGTFIYNKKLGFLVAKVQTHRSNLGYRIYSHFHQKMLVMRWGPQDSSMAIVPHLAARVKKHFLPY
jgi:hypothetical protein